MNVAQISDLGTVFQRVVGFALGFAGVVLFIVLLMGGFKFITSGGDPKAVDSAKKTLTYGVGGLLVILVSYLILLLISNITGVNVTKFNVVLPP
jgi:hypothetical protein